MADQIQLDGQVDQQQTDGPDWELVRVFERER